MLFSKNNFFKQSYAVLKARRYDVYNLLIIKGYTHRQVEIYLKAYDYFTNNPELFDGATIAKDLDDISNLDLDAMLHDYHFLVYSVPTSFKYKFLADWLYAKGNEKKGKGILVPYSRLLLLCIVGLFLTPYCMITRKSMTDRNKVDFINEYNELLKQK